MTTTLFLTSDIKQGSLILTRDLEKCTLKTIVVPIIHYNQVLLHMLYLT
jgi:hypothetical protein